MDQETKQCEKCLQNFAIQADDLPFYEKMDLPLPTMCPNCRFKYLLAFWVFGRFRITKSALVDIVGDKPLYPTYKDSMKDFSNM